MLIVLARIGKDAELATTQSGKQLMKFSAAFSQGYGEHEKTVWLQCVKWGDKNAGICQYLTKGQQVLLHCSEIEPEAYQDRQGAWKAVIKATVSNIQLAGSKQDGQRQPQGQQYQQPAQSQPQRQQAPQQAPQGQGFAEFDDDIPF